MRQTLAKTQTIRIAKNHHEGNAPNHLDELNGDSTQAEWTTTHLSTSEGFQQSNPEREVPATDHRRCGHTIAWGKGLYQSGCKNKFWHVRLDEESSFFTFHTPFGWYRWHRMPFAICSAPEVYQWKMHEVINGLAGVNVVADDFLVIGSGGSLEEAIKDHDRNLLAF